MSGEIHNLDGEIIGYFIGEKKNLTSEELPEEWQRDDDLEDRLINGLWVNESLQE